MKKFTYLMISFLMVAMISNAQTLNNPKDADGYYIVKWDCSQDAFAAANDIEADETFTIAVDVTGTPFEDWLKETPTAAGATRAMALNPWTNFGTLHTDSPRLKQIGENIYGATWNIIQMANTLDVAAATGIDSIVYVNGQVFGFEFTAESPGANWWMWPETVPAGTEIDPGTGNIFRTLPYTGTKTDTVFYSDDIEGGLFFSNNTPVQGYTVPCAFSSPSALIEVFETDAQIIGHEYYNILGQKLQIEPRQGLYIHRKIKADGTSEVVKEFKIREY